MSISFTVYGQLWSMKNHRIPLKQNPYKTIPDQKARLFAQQFMSQVPIEATRTRLEGPLRAIVTVFYPSQRQDLDCALVYDLLQKAAVITNDRQIIEKHEFRETDKVNPRVEITVEPI